MGFIGGFILFLLGFKVSLPNLLGFWGDGTRVSEQRFLTV